jgi:anti-sigma-K factor RskA
MTDPLSCDQCDEWLPGYVLNALTLEEATATAAHLQTCARCQARLVALEATVGRLGETVTLHEPPPELRRNLMAMVAADLAPRSPESQAPQPRWRHLWTSRWIWALTAANAVLFLGAAWFAWQAWSNLPHGYPSWHQMAQAIAVQRQALALLTEATSRRVMLNNGTQARGTLLLQSTTAQAVLIVQNLPPLPSNRVYQLWLIRDGIRDNGGIFQVDNQGFGMLFIQAPHTFNAYQAAGITAEPAGGSPGPTSPRVIGGKL